MDPFVLQLIALALGSATLGAFIWGMYTTYHEGLAFILAVVCGISTMACLIASGEVTNSRFEKACFGAGGMPVRDSSHSRLCIATEHLIQINEEDR